MTEKASFIRVRAVRGADSPLFPGHLPLDDRL